MPLLDSQARPESRRYKGQAHGGAQTNARTLRVHGPYPVYRAAPINGSL